VVEFALHRGSRCSPERAATRGVAQQRHKRLGERTTITGGNQQAGAAGLDVVAHRRRIRGEHGLAHRHRLEHDGLTTGIAGGERRHRDDGGASEQLAVRAVIDRIHNLDVGRRERGQLGARRDEPHPHVGAAHGLQQQAVVASAVATDREHIALLLPSTGREEAIVDAERNVPEAVRLYSQLARERLGLITREAAHPIHAGQRAPVGAQLALIQISACLREPAGGKHERPGGKRRQPASTRERRRHALVLEQREHELSLRDRAQ
jgi:hypothetical protein